MAVIAFTDTSFTELDVELPILKPLGCEIRMPAGKTQAELIALTRDADYVITQFAKVDATVIAAMTRAKVIVRYGIGVDNIDLDAARKHGIPVCNVPDYCIDEVADHALSFILALCRQTTAVSNYIQNEKYGLAVPLSSLKVLKEQTIGVIGFGRIGREVCARLKAFKCQVRVFDPVVPADAIQSQGCIPSTLDELLSKSDVITLHCPSNAHTRKIINGQSIAKMKKGALLVNVARGDLIDSAALVEALKSGQLLGAALDVFDPEPIPADHPVLKMSNVVLAPHVACGSVTAVRRLRESVAQHVVRAHRGKTLTCIVNGVLLEKAAR
jgi:D-3-phosphoglycerate dehydrogenase